MVTDGITEIAVGPDLAAPDYARLAQDAVIWGLPLVLFGRYLDTALKAGLPFNRFFMNADVATPKSHAVGPNVDTLNGRAWLDLTREPQIIGVPDTADRYYSIQLQDMYMNSFAYIGRRTTGTKAGAFAITPPGFTGALPTGVTEIKAPTGKVLAFVRTLVRDQEGLAAARTINAAFTLGSLSAYPDGQHAASLGGGAIDVFQPKSRRERNALPHQDLASAGITYFDELDQLVRSFPPSTSDAPNLARFASLGVGALKPVRRATALEAELAAAVPAGIATLMRSLETWSVNGWSRRGNVAPFIQDPVQRAANNIYGPGTQIAEESIFFNKRQGPDGASLSGAKAYRLCFPPNQTPPVDAFWSLTLYDGNYVLFDNPIDRYSIGDRTEGLRYGEDGALEIQIQADEPVGGISNWLPAPRDEFQLVLRTYQPRKALLDGSYSLPPLEIAVEM